MLYGVSAVGTKLCVYSYGREDQTLVPEGIERDIKRVNDRAPASRWNLDITTPQGAERLREVVAHPPPPFRRPSTGTASSPSLDPKDGLSTTSTSLTPSPATPRSRQ